MNVTEVIFGIRSCAEILANDNKIDTTDQYNVLQWSFKIYLLGWMDGWTDGWLGFNGILSTHWGNLHPLRGKRRLNMYNLI